MSPKANSSTAPQAIDPELETLAEHFPVNMGDTFKEGRYEVLRKLGGGVFSNIWLVRDRDGETGFRYKALKVVTLEGTSYHEKGIYLELEVMQAVAALEDPEQLPILRDNFTEKGPIGSHLCMITDIYGTNVSALRRSSTRKVLPVYMVRNIISHTVDALTQLHKLGIVHTDVKPDNLLIGTDSSDEAIEKFLDENPVEFDGEYQIEGTNYTIFKSQPIPHIFSPESSPFQAELMSTYLTDLGQAQFMNRDLTTDEFSAYALRSPELILRSDFGPPIDIWAVGCITFELLVGRWLFNPEETEYYSLEDEHLARMMEITGEKFPPQMLKRSKLRDQFFNKKGKLIRFPELDHLPLETALRNYDVLPEDEIKPAADFILACIHLDPRQRPSAEELQDHPWLENAFKC
ncbi:kinase-like domain-containing protein [Abortiporus biennis]|nr:kinase-like domain-containing protein [Abortiporus biennis]